MITVHGDVTAASEDALMDAYTRAAEGSPRAILLDFSGLEYMNSGGIGLLVTLLVRANRAKQQLLALRAQRPLPPDLRADPARRGDFDLRRRGRSAGRRLREDTMSEQQQNTARDEGNWATPVDRLSATNVPAGALDTVGGKQVVSPIQGFGKMWQKTYRVSLAGAERDAGRGDRGLEGPSSRPSGRRAASSTHR